MRPLLIVPLLISVFLIILIIKILKSYKNGTQNDPEAVRKMLSESWFTFVWPVRALWNLGSRIRGSLHDTLWKHYHLPRMERHATIEWRGDKCVKVGYSRGIRRHEQVFHTASIYAIPQTRVWYVEYDNQVVRGDDNEVFLNRDNAETDAERVLNGTHKVKHAVLDATHVYGFYWRASRYFVQSSIPAVRFMLYHPNSRDSFGHLEFEPGVGVIDIKARSFDLTLPGDNVQSVPVGELPTRIHEFVEAEEEAAIKRHVGSSSS